MTMTRGMMFKGTPGPWFMEDGKDDGWIIAKNDALVCMMNAGLSHEEMSDTEKHDSNLIMAAPDLLAVAHKVVNNWGNLHHKDLMQLRAAIAKALGEQK